MMYIVAHSKFCRKELDAKYTRSLHQLIRGDLLKIPRQIDTIPKNKPRVRTGYWARFENQRDKMKSVGATLSIQ